MDPKSQKLIARLAMIDLVLVGPMAIPPVALLVLSIFGDLDAMIGLESPLGMMTPLGLIFMNIVGILAAVWSIIRIRETSRLNTLLDTIARIGVALILVYGVSQIGLSLMFGLFLVTEIGGAALQAMALMRDKQAVAHA